VLTTEALAAAGLAPTGVVGGRVGAWGGNLKFGGAERFVVEADEYDRSFLALTPGVAVVTNVEADHLDIYADLADIVGDLRRVRRRGALRGRVRRRPGRERLPYPASAEVVRYSVARARAPRRGRGRHPDARLVARGCTSTPTGAPPSWSGTTGKR
jgi:UDP-N-acetylmuramate--alanine ligase